MVGPARPPRTDAAAAPFHPGSRRGAATMLAPMRNERLLVAAAAVVGVALIVLAIVYWAEPAGSLPSFFPGYQAGSSHVHFKHGLAALLVGLAVLVFVWFRTGPKRSPTGRVDPRLADLLPAGRSSSGSSRASPSRFPISSLGHAVILPRLLGWNIHQNDPYFIAFLVATHLATALVLLGVLLARLGADPQGARPLAARPRHRPRRRRREARLAARRGHDPGRHPRAAAPGQAARRRSPRPARPRPS